MESGLIGPQQLSAAALVVAALVFFRLLPLRLSQGESRWIDTGVVVFGLLLFGSGLLLLCSVISSALVSFVYSRRTLASRKAWVAEHAAALLVQVAAIQLAGIGGSLLREAGTAGDDLVLARATAVGLVYWTFTEFGYRVLAGFGDVEQIKTRLRMPLAEAVVLAQVVHISLAAAALRALGTLGVFSPLFSLLLAAVLHYGLVLYMRMQAAYAQTIRAVSAAISMALGEREEEPAILADLCVRVARKVGCRGKVLKYLNEAALMSRIGMLSYSADTREGSESSHRTGLPFLEHSARAVVKIPYLSGAAQVLDPSLAAGDVEEFKSANQVLRACVLYEYARQMTDRAEAALDFTRQECEGCSERVLRALAEAVAAR